MWLGAGPENGHLSPAPRGAMFIPGPLHQKAMSCWPSAADATAW